MQTAAVAPPPTSVEPPPAALEAELRALVPVAREALSVDSFVRAAIEGFVWAILAGVFGKLLWDSRKVPLFLYPMAFFETFLLIDALSAYLRGKRQLQQERAVRSRLRALRLQLGIDLDTGLPALPLEGRDP